jgi:uncharacterized protein YceK
MRWHFLRRIVTVCQGGVLAFMLGGCGTVVNCVNVNGTPAKQIYGGVRQDARNGKDHLAEAFSGSCPSFSPYPEQPSPGKELMTRSFCAGCGVCMLAIDLPVCAVADTLTLPVTIPATLMNRKARPKRNNPPNAARTPAATMPVVQQ